MKSKKIISLLLMLSLVFSTLVACSDDVEQGSSDKGGDVTEQGSTKSDQDSKSVDDAKESQGLQPEEGAELLVWENQGPEGEFMEFAIEEFNKIYPDVTITYEPVTHSDAKGKLALDGPAGVGADVFVAPHDHLGELVESGLVLPNELDEGYEDIFVSAALQSVTYKDEVYGYPLAIETYALFYNKDVVDKPVTTWNELKEFAKGFNNSVENKFALMFEAENSYYDYMFLGGYGSELFGESGEDRMDLGFDTEAGVEAMEFLYSIRKDIMDVPAADISYDVMMQGFVSGQFPYMINGPWAIQDLKDEGVNFGVTELPVLPNGKHPQSFSGVRSLYVSQFTDYPNASMLFADFLVSSEMTKARFEKTNQIPVRDDYQVEDEYIAGIKEQSKYAKPMPAIPEMGHYWTTMDATYTNIWEGSDPKTELDAAKEAMLAMYE